MKGASTCSECHRPVKQPSNGRPRETCSPTCSRERNSRQKREARATARNRAAAENSPAEVAYAKELRHWMRTGQHVPRLDTSTIVSVWLGHDCDACR